MEQMINIYFDTKGNIRSVTPVKDENFSKLEVAEFPLSMVEMFLTGKASLSNYLIDKFKIKGTVAHKITKKSRDTVYVRSIDNYPVKIDVISDVGRTVIIENRVKEKVIAISIDNKFKNLYDKGTEEEQEAVANFLEQGTTSVYITQKNEPYFLLFTVRFLPRQLFNEGTLYINYEDDCYSTSAYAKRIIGGYTYSEKI